MKVWSAAIIITLADGEEVPASVYALAPDRAASRAALDAVIATGADGLIPDGATTRVISTRREYLDAGEPEET